jgi:heat shock protein beta
LDQPIDEYLLQAVTEYKGTKLQSVAKKGLVYGDENEESKKREEEQTEEYKPLTEKIKTLLDAHISEVVLSNRLTSSPCAVVAQQWALSGAMERIIQSQPTGKDDFMKDFYLKQKKIFEINPVSDLINSLVGTSHYENLVRKGQVHARG